MYKMIGQLDSAHDLRCTLTNELLTNSGRYQIDESGQKISMFELVQMADVVYVNDHKIKNRFGPTVVLSTSPWRDFPTNLGEPTVKSGYFIYWDEDNRLLKFESKVYERQKKIEKILKSQ